MRNAPRLPHQQQGVALLTVVLIVSIVTILATAMANRQHIDIRRAANVLAIDQLDQYAQGGELLAARILWEDRQDGEHDEPEETWAMPAAFAVEGGDIGGQMVDLNRYLNINNLLDKDGKPDLVEIERMRRLFNLMDQDALLVDALVDWIDSDQEPYNMNGAEDNEYLLLDPPYRTANKGMLSISELRLVRGFTDEVIKELVDDDGKPLLTAFKRGSKVNINTAPWQVIAASLKGVDTALAEDVAAEVFTEQSALLQNATLNSAQNKDQIEVMFGVSSDYFLLNSLAVFGNRELSMYSIMKRDGATGESVVIYRSQGVY